MVQCTACNHGEPGLLPSSLAFIPTGLVFTDFLLPWSFFDTWGIQVIPRVAFASFRWRTITPGYQESKHSENKII